MRRSRLFVLSVGVSLLAIMSVLLPSSASAAGNRVTINLTAVVDLVDNPFGADIGDIAADDVITGSYTYNPKTTDSSDSVLVGDYPQDKKKYSMQLDLGSFSVQTVDFGIGIANGVSNLDNYVVGSLNVVSPGRGSSASIGNSMIQRRPPCRATLSRRPRRCCHRGRGTG